MKVFHLLFQNPNQKPVILRKRRQRIKIEANWELFYYRYHMIFSRSGCIQQLFFFYLTFLNSKSSVSSRFQLDHARSNLIWNLKTREELRDALEGEMRAFSVDRELGSATVISWNHQEFEVCVQLQYAALAAMGCHGFHLFPAITVCNGQLAILL